VDGLDPTRNCVRSASYRTQFAFDLASDLRSEVPFHSKRIRRTRDPGLLWSHSMVPKVCFQKRELFFAHNFKKSLFAIQFFHYRLPLRPAQLPAISRVNIVAKSNKFLFPMILVWDRKRVTIARYSVEDHLTGWWVGRRIFILSLGDKRLDIRESLRGRSDEAFTLHFWGVRCPPRASGPRRTGSPMEWKRTVRLHPPLGHFLSSSGALEGPKGCVRLQV